MNKIIRLFDFFGFDVKKFVKNILGIFWYLNDYKNFKKQLDPNSKFKVNFYPILHERTTQSGTASGHYFNQDLLVAMKIFVNRPQKHVDIGSRVDGFVAHVASFREIEVFDIRLLNSNCENIKFKQADFTHLPYEYYNYTDSISCLHAIEHFGLGRYSDTIDVNGHLKGLESINKMLKTGGNLYLSVPIGDLRIEFNAHRVFSISYLLELFNRKYSISDFSFVDDRGDLHTKISLSKDKIIGNCGCKYGCGIFELVKL